MYGWWWALLKCFLSGNFAIFFSQAQISKYGIRFVRVQVNKRKVLKDALNYFVLEAQINWFVDAFMAWFSKLVGGSPTQSFIEKRKSCLALVLLDLSRSSSCLFIQYLHYNFALKSKGLSRPQDNKYIIRFGKNSFHHAKTLSDKYLENSIKTSNNSVL